MSNKENRATRNGFWSWLMGQGWSGGGAKG